MGWRSVLCLLGILALAGALRVWEIDHDSLWTDELLSLQFSTGRGFAHERLPVGTLLQPMPDLTSLQGAPPWRAVWANSAEDMHPPLFNLLLRLWRVLFGDAIAAVRALSAVLSVVAVLLLFDAARYTVGTAAALWAALLMAAAAPQIAYAQEVRGYVLAVAMTLGACAAGARIIARGASWLRVAALGSALLGSMLTHYLTAGLLAPLGIYLLVVLRGRDRARVLGAVVAAAVLWLALWGPMYLRQRANVQDVASWIGDDREGLLLRSLARASLVPIRHFFEPGREMLAVAHAGVALLVLPLLLPHRRRLLPWWLCAAGPMVLVMVFDLWQSTRCLGLTRYTLIAAGPIFVLVAGLLAHRRDWLRWALPSVLLAGMLVPPVLARMSNLSDTRYAASLERSVLWKPLKPDWRRFIGTAAGRFHPDDLVVVYQPPEDHWYAGILFLGLGYYASPVPAPVLVLRGPSDETVASRTRTAESIWLLSAPAGAPVGRLFPGSRVVESWGDPDIGIWQRVVWSGSTQ